MHKDSTVSGRGEQSRGDSSLRRISGTNGRQPELRDCPDQHRTKAGAIMCNIIIISSFESACYYRY